MGDIGAGGVCVVILEAKGSHLRGYLRRLNSLMVAIN